MVFKVKARVLLELGAELISSDGIALYELVKNAVDAKSRKIQLDVHVALTPSGYRAIDKELAATNDSLVKRGYAQRAIARAFDPGTSEELREEFLNLIADTSPLRARSALRQFFLDNTYISIEDWGCGMSASDLENHYLTIGTPHRALERNSAPKQEIILGEKGIGRLSAMRLGDTLGVYTGTKNDTHWQALEIDWSKLSDLDMNLDQFPVRPTKGDSKSIGDKGTLIEIRDLKSEWTSDRFNQLAASELAKLQDPFDLDATALDLRLSFNGNPIQFSSIIRTEFFDDCHGYFDVSMSYEPRQSDGQLEPVLHGVVRFKIPDDGVRAQAGETEERIIHASGDGLYSLLASNHHPAAADGQLSAIPRFDGIDTLGPFEARGYWYNRQRSKLEKKAGGQSYDPLGRWLLQWAGGLLMYRDGYRVYPYAEPDDDWLELDQKALRQRAFKLNRGQFVGYVRIGSRTNPHLRDQTNRQGLCDSPEKRALIQALQWVIWNELGSLVRKHEIKSTARALGTMQQVDRQFKDKSRAVRGVLKELGRRAPSERETVAELRAYVEDVEASWSKAKATIRKQEGQAGMYLHLAGVGMLLEFVVHELARVTQSSLSDLQSQQQATLPPSLRSLTRQLQTLDKRLRILDPVATPGRQRKEDTDVAEVIHTLVDAHEQQFDRHAISVDTSRLPAVFISTAVAGQMYQIFENLISNSVYWLTHHRSVLAKHNAISTFSASITVEGDYSDRTIVFKDNGGGISAEDGPKVFDPFFSKKPTGRGIGLYIVKTLCAENGIEVELLPATKGRINGFKFTFQ
ncbi:sensor histidine kinase [Xanthomonas nasturtii]|uniref:sensor histidine kinase n=1 Tax=Xanthomonas TaxID=338 RepID=UPI002B229168|nr:sensor histidine kinase [Xanthomonas nasturtii]MEA9557612.1 sensor histidine kinase [Xanthomonas nasturtii]